MRLKKDAKNEFAFDAWNVLEIYRELVCCALAGKLISYNELASKIGLEFYNSKMKLETYNHEITNHRKQFGLLLKPISNYTDDQYKILLTALVVRQEDNIPGEGFFDMVAEMGFSVGNRKQKAAQVFARKAQRKVFKHYSTKAILI